MAIVDAVPLLSLVGLRTERSLGFSGLLPSCSFSLRCPFLRSLSDGAGDERRPPLMEITPSVFTVLTATTLQLWLGLSD
jgi:hypothetical protein